MIRKRIAIIMGVFLLIFSLLLVRYFYYQLLHGPKISKMAVAAHSQGIDLREFSRGEILDRHLLTLTSFPGTQALFCRPQEIPDRNGSKNCSSIAHFLAANIKDMNENDVLQHLLTARKKNSVLIKLHDNLSQTEITQIQAAHIPSLVIAPTTKRYRQDGFMAHLIGYNPNAPIESKDNIENAYNDTLKKGGNSLVLNAFTDGLGNEIPGLALKVKSEENPKDAVVLTIDKHIQEVVEKAMNEKVNKGAVVIMDVKSKEILAMASRPTFNQYRVEESLADVDSPLMNRAVSAYYPGSLFKIVVSAAALQNHIVKLDDSFNCTGKYQYNDQLATDCWKKEGHGQLTFAEAFANSCNPTFIRVGLKLGRDRLLQQVEKIHLTYPGMIGLEQATANTYVKIDSSDAALGNACLGQQGVMLTPLQITSLLATVADNGYWAPPVVVSYTVDEKGNKKFTSQGKKIRVIDPDTNRKIQQMMEKVVADGTGKAAGLPEVQIAGKTATSETGNIVDGKDVLNTWFAGYFPADQPRWAIVVLVEEGKSGAQNCAPVFKDIGQGMLALSP